MGCCKNSRNFHDDLLQPSRLDVASQFSVVLVYRGRKGTLQDDTSHRNGAVSSIGNNISVILVVWYGKQVHMGPRQCENKQDTALGVLDCCRALCSVDPS